MSKKILKIIREHNKNDRIIFFAFLFKDNYEMKYYIKISGEWKDNFTIISIKESVEKFKKIKSIINEYKIKNNTVLIIDSEKEHEIYEGISEQKNMIEYINKIIKKYLML